MKKGKSHVFKLAIILTVVILSVLLMLATSVLVYWAKTNEKKMSKSKTSSAPAFMTDTHLKLSYADLYRGTDGFSPNNLLGAGGFGSVYKGFLDHVEETVAVKVFNLQQNGASKSFKAECKALKSIRHRNLVKIVTYCSSIDYKHNEFKALVFEFMANGSLEKWLHPNADSEIQSETLNFLQRLKIAIDIASAVHYLHDLCGTPIIHCDLKPSNILLDDDMVAHVSDFGLARLFSTPIMDLSQSQTSTMGVKGTVGYAAPEYGMGGAASKHGDVYSYGILLLEMFTGKRPTDEMFKDGLNLHYYVKSALPNKLLQVLDPYLLSEESEATQVAREVDNDDDIEGEEGSSNCQNLRMMRGNAQRCLVSVLEIGVACSAESARERMSMEDVTRKLHLITNAFIGS